MRRGRNAVPAVAGTLPLAFAVHDLEEVLAASWWSRTGPRLLGERTRLPARRVRTLTATTSPQMAVATSVVGVGVAAVALSGLRGRERPIRAAVTVFTAHGLGHLATTALLRSYTPGAVTAATVVIPWGVWASRVLGRDVGTPSPHPVRDRALSGLGTIALAVAGHVLGRRLLPGGPPSAR